jgi:hypothetical protein
MAPFLTALTLFVSTPPQGGPSVATSLRVEHPAALAVRSISNNANKNNKQSSARRAFASSLSSSKLSQSTSASDTGLSKQEARYTTLVDWVSSAEGSKIGPITIAPSKSGIGYGMFLTQAVKKNDIILEIPEEVCLSERIFLLDNDIGDTLKTNIYEKAGPGGNIVCLAGWLAKEWVMLQLKSERNNGEVKYYEETEFEKYLKTLPWSSSSQDHVLFWSEEDVSRLFKGSIAQEDATGLREEVAYAKRILSPLLLPIITRMAGMESFKAPLLPWLKDEEAEAKQQKLKVMFDNAVTGAFVITLSRSFQDSAAGTSSSTGERLIPVLDMIQHGSDHNISHKVNRETFNVEVRARQDLDAGVELYNQYLKSEEMSPYKFFTRFGFVPDVRESAKALLERRDQIFFPGEGRGSAQQAEV